MHLNTYFEYLSRFSEYLHIYSKHILKKNVLLPSMLVFCYLSENSSIRVYLSWPQLTSIVFLLDSTPLIRLIAIVFTTYVWTAPHRSREKSQICLCARQIFMKPIFQAQSIRSIYLATLYTYTCVTCYLTVINNGMQLCEITTIFYSLQKKKMVY